MQELNELNWYSQVGVHEGFYKAVSYSEEENLVSKGEKMIKNPKVSIIVTNYNYGHYLTELVNSILVQSYKNWELIIVDDGSNDGSKEIIARFEQQYANIKGVYKENTGMTDSFCEGMKIAKGDIICTLDADDYYLPSTLQRKVDMHLKHPQAAIVDSAITEDGIHPTNQSRDDINFHECFVKYGYAYSFSATSGLSFTRQALEKFMPLEKTHDDYGGLEVVLVMLALAIGDVVFDRNLSVFRRSHLDENVKEEREKSYKDRAFYYHRYELNIKYAFSQLRLRGYNIPEDDFEYYKKIIREILDQIKDKRVVIYGTSKIGEKCAKALEFYQVPICCFADSQEKRIWGSKEIKLPYEIVSKTELCNMKNEYDKIIIGSRQSAEIVKDLQALEIPESEIIVLPL